MAFVPDPDHRLGNQMYDAHVSPIVSEGSDADGDQHILRRISERALVQSFVDLLAERNVYMADGHHRYESALAARDERPASNFVLMGILRDSDDGLNVGATHRVIHADVPADLPARLAASFNVADASLEALDSLEPGSHDLGLITASGAYLLQPTDAPSAMPASVPSAWRNLAPAILQYAILEPLLGIGDQELAGGQAVTYTHFVSKAGEAVRNWRRLGRVHPARRDVAGRDRDGRRRQLHAAEEHLLRAQAPHRRRPARARLIGAGAVQDLAQRRLQSLDNGRLESGLLNSSLMLWHLSQAALTSGKGTRRWGKIYVENIPIPRPDSELSLDVAKTVERILGRQVGSRIGRHDPTGTRARSARLQAVRRGDRRG